MRENEMEKFALIMKNFSGNVNVFRKSLEKKFSDNR
jgi:hypothetical protein